MLRDRTSHRTGFCAMAMRKWRQMVHASAKRGSGLREQFTIRMKQRQSDFPMRGEVWWINFDPAVGTEAKKTRPAIVVSNDISNEFLERIQVVPLTGNTAKLYPSEALVVLKGKKSKAAADQVATVSKMRVQKRIGQLTASELD